MIKYILLFFFNYGKNEKIIIVTKKQQKQIKTAYFWGKQKQNKKFFIKHTKNQKKILEGVI